MAAGNPLRWALGVSALVSVPLLLWANSNGGPLAHTGSFGEPGCDLSGCHISNPLPPGGGRVVIDVGPYVPGQTQHIRITVVDAGARRWGFQLSAWQASSQRQAGSFQAAEGDPFVRVRCASGFDPPCNPGEQQYAVQTSVGTHENSPVGLISWRVDWNPPGEDVGPVLFGAAGLGADGDLGTNGDHSYATTAISVFGPGNVPTVSQVANTAGLTPANVISQGTLVSLSGQKLGPPGVARELTRGEVLDGQLPIELNRLGVDFFVPGNPDPLPGYVIYISEQEVDVQVPALSGYNGPADVQPVFNRGQGGNEIRGKRVSVYVQDLSPGLFTLDGRRVVVADIFSSAGATVGRGGLVVSDRSLHPGDIVQIYGTGFGQAQPTVAPGVLGGESGPLVNPVTITIGGKMLGIGDILFAGSLPSLVGVQQFRFRLPTGLGSGDLPIAVSVRGLSSQPGAVLRVGGQRWKIFGQ